MAKKISVVVLEQEGDDPETARPLVASDDHDIASQCASIIARRLGIGVSLPSGPQLVQDTSSVPNPNESPAASRARQEAERQAREREREREERERATRLHLELYRGTAAEPAARVAYTDDAELLEEFAQQVRAGGFGGNSPYRRPALLALRRVPLQGTDRPSPSEASTQDPAVVAAFCRAILAGSIDGQGRRGVESMLADVEQFIRFAEQERAEQERAEREAVEARERERQEAEARMRAAQEADPRDRDGWALRLRRDSKVVARTDLRDLLQRFAPRLAAGEPGPESATIELVFGRVDGGIAFPEGAPFQPSGWHSHLRSSDSHLLHDFLHAFLAAGEGSEEEREAAEDALAALEAEGVTDA